MEKKDINLKEFDIWAEKLKALGHAHRLCILKGLIMNECNVTKICECLELPQSTVSQHIAKLKSVNLIEGERRGNEICYSVKDEKVKEIIELIIDK